MSLANNGIEALRKVSEKSFALVLMDMQMPEMGGLEATRAIRQLDGWKHTPIIAMTANAFAEDRAKCLAVGMNDFVSKPFEPNKLFGTLLRWLQANHKSN